MAKQARTLKEAPSLGVTRELSLHMYKQMLQIREFETHVNELYQRAKMPGLAHLYAGEEAIAVGVCAALRRDDTITSTHRGHGHCLAKGASIDRMFCELLGKGDGYCRGKGGSMHIADYENGNLGANAIVGGSFGIATGSAFAAKRLGQDRVSVCFFGEGALGQGSLYEVMNMASLWGLPIIYVCENNLYNEYTPYREALAGSLTARPEAFGIETEEVDGQDVLAVYESASRAVARARAGGGPSFRLCSTYRYYGHHVGDVDRAFYRSKEEETSWQTERDPIQLFATRLVGEGVASQKELDEIKAAVEAEVAAAVEMAEAAPYPDLSEVAEHVYA